MQTRAYTYVLVYVLKTAGNSSVKVTDWLDLYTLSYLLHYLRYLHIYILAQLHAEATLLPHTYLPTYLLPSLHG